MPNRKFILICLVVIGLLSGCASAADFDLRGEWEYTMTDTNGNTYDAGVISFRGQASEGTYLQTNIYQVEYEGEFTVNGASLQLTGYETWEGTLTDANTINGTWSHDDGFRGTFVATRK